MGVLHRPRPRFGRHRFTATRNPSCGGTFPVLRRSRFRIFNRLALGRCSILPVRYQLPLSGRMMVTDELSLKIPLHRHDVYRRVSGA